MKVRRRWYGGRVLKMVTGSLERMGRSVEAVPGWPRAERFLDEVADGFAFGLALLWALRAYWFVLAVALVVTGLDG